MRGVVLGLVGLALAGAAASPAEAGLFSRKARPPAAAAPVAAPVADAAVAEIRRALDEQRYVDAGRQIDQALAAGARDPRLLVLLGELQIARGRCDAALKTFTDAAATASVAAAADQGEGVCLSLLGRSDQAVPVLQRAVAADRSLWRAWNALGREYDGRQNWPAAEAAYATALEVSGGKAAVYNNRGFSRLLQGRHDQAAADFVEALKNDPNLGAARANLRLALALQGDYGRATTAGPQEDRAAVLNNAGYAALLRGDFGRAETLLTEAVAGRGEFYRRASENLALARSLKARAGAETAATQGSPADAVR
jgi:Flp pilus assembly protein TadD